jgi:thiosulfate reductase cytochrome b subunit
MHWVNFPLLLVMVWSGLRIYWANDVRRVGIGDWTLVQLFPQWVYDLFQLDRKLAKGLAFHMTFGWLFALNGLAFAIYLGASGHWRRLIPRRGWPADALRVLAHDLHLSRRPLPEQGVYNAAQRLTYSAVILLGGVAVLSGFAIFKPTQLSVLTTALGGYRTARAIHFWTTMAFVGFFAVHVLQVLRAGWGTLTSMITGYRVVDPPPGAAVSSGDDGPTPAAGRVEEASDVR